MGRLASGSRWWGRRRTSGCAAARTGHGRCLPGAPAWA